MNNTLNDLNNYLFEALEKIQDYDINDDELNKEITRSKAIQGVAKTIIENGHLALEAKKHMDFCGEGQDMSVGVLGITSSEKKNG